MTTFPPVCLGSASSSFHTSLLTCESPTVFFTMPPKTSISAVSVPCPSSTMAHAWLERGSGSEVPPPEERSVQSISLASNAQVSPKVEIELLDPLKPRPP